MSVHQPRFDKLRLRPVKGTRYTFDVERHWDGGDYVWIAQILFDPRGDQQLMSGDMTLGEASAIRTERSRILARLTEIVTL